MVMGGPRREQEVYVEKETEKLHNHEARTGGYLLSKGTSREQDRTFGNQNTIGMKNLYED